MRDDQTFSYNFFLCTFLCKIPTSHPGPEAAIINPSTPCFSIRMTFLMCETICFMPDARHPKRPLVTHLSFECYFKRLGEHLRNKPWCFSWLPMVSVLQLSHKPHFGPSFFLKNVVSWLLTSAQAMEACSSLALPFGIFSDFLDELLLCPHETFWQADHYWENDPRFRMSSFWW